MAELSRGDVKGATHLAIFGFSCSMPTWFCIVHHVPSPVELANFGWGPGWALTWGGIGWVVYVALEPSPGGAGRKA